MTDELFPCAHCNGPFRIGYSQRVKATIGEKEFDYSRYGRNFEGPPLLGDTARRPPSAPQTERLVCIYCPDPDCGMQTPWVPVGDDEDAAMTKAGRIWNRRFNRPPATEGDLLDMVRKELSVLDSPFVMDLLARNTEDWETRGPLFSMLAQKISDSTINMSDFWPIDPILHDASRYRRLVQHVKFIYIHGVESVQFPRIPGRPNIEHCPFEKRIAAAVDDLPPRNAW